MKRVLRHASNASTAFKAFALARHTVLPIALLGSASILFGAPVRLALTGPSALRSAVCSAAYSVTAQDNTGAPVPVSVATRVDVRGFIGSIFMDPQCRNPVQYLTLATGASSQQFFLGGTRQQVSI